MPLDATISATFSEPMDTATITPGSIVLSQLVRVSAVAAGFNYTLLLKDDGTVSGWGYNGQGQTTVPAGLSGVTAIAAMSNHNLALKSDGTVIAWGDNGSGQTDVPVGLLGVTAVAAGGYHSVALKNDGTVTAWGYNLQGETDVPGGLGGVTRIAAGIYHTLALKSDGTVIAWGDNSNGLTTVPAGLSGVINVAAGAYHSLALKADGTVVAWGMNNSGQSSVPGSLSGVVAIAAGLNFSMALKNDGTVIAWGDNSYGQTGVPAGLSGITAIAAGSNHAVALKDDGSLVFWGDNSCSQTTVPVELAGVTAVAAGDSHTIALQNDGTLYAWGYNGKDQADIPAGLSGVTSLAAGLEHSLALHGSGRVTAWGGNDSGQTIVPTGLDGVIAIAAGDGHSVALRNDGTVAAWGLNLNGQASVPGGLATATKIAAGSAHTLALKQDGTVIAWGSNQYNAIAVPAGLTGVTAIAAGGYHSVALKGDGTLSAWGDNTSGQGTIPSGLTNVIAIAAGYSHTVALKNDGTVVAWGDNYHGQSAVPAGLSGVAGIAAGRYNTIAVRKDGTIVIWGKNKNGQSTVPHDLYKREIASTISYSTGSDIVTITPIASLPPAATVAATVNRGVRSIEGTPPAADYSWSFTTVDSVSPVTTVSPPGGTYSTPQIVTLTANEPATIYYTTNGATPTTAAPVYTGPIPIAVTTVLKYFARDIAGNSEAPKTTSYIINLDTTPPVTSVSPPGGTYNAPQSVTLTANEPATIYYTTNGATPTTAAPVYSGPIPIAVTTVLKYFARDAAGNNEALKTTSYVINLDTTPPVTTASPPGGTYSSPQSVTLTANEPATIYYTTNGATPTTAAPVYAGPIPIPLTTALKFFARDTAGNSEAVKTQSYTIKSNQTITFGALADKVYGNAPFTLGATASSGLPVSYSSSNPAVATINGSTVTILGSGTITITANQNGDALYNPAPAVTRTLVVNKATLTVRAADAARIYGAVNPPFSATYSGFVNGDTQAVLTGLPDLATIATSSSAVGTYPITVAVGTLAAGNYTFSFVSGTLTVTKAGQTITFEALPAKTYGDGAFALTGTAGSGLAVTYASSNSAVATVSGSTVTIVGAGNATITASQAGDVNYYPAADVSHALTVNKATAGVTLENLSTAYDGTPKTATATTVPAGLTVALTYNGVSTAPTAAGSYAVVGTVSDPNYQGSASATLTIAKANQTISFDPLPAKTYGDAAFALTGTAGSGLAVTYTSSNNAVATVSGSTVTIVGAGTATITASQAGDGNYLLAVDVPRTLTINKATAGVTLESLSTTYDGTPKSATATTVPAGLTVAMVYNGLPTAPTTAGSYAVVGTVTDPNYQGSASATLTIAKANQTISFDPLPVKTYGDGAFALTGTAGSGLAVSYTSSNSAVATVSGSTVTIVGAGSAIITAAQGGDVNYNPAPGVAQTLTVNKAQATITFGAISFTYDGNPKPVTVTTIPVGLSVAVTYDGLAAPPVDVGKYNVVATVNDANYQGSAAAIEEISKKSQTITFDPLPVKTYGDAPFTFSASASSNLNLTFEYDPTIATIIKQGKNYLLTIVGAGTTTITATQPGNRNYSDAPPVSRMLVVNKAAATVTLGSLSATYDGSAKAATATTTPAGLAVTFTYDGSASPPTAAGSHAVIGTINNANYQGSASGTLTIAKASQTVTFGALPARSFGDAPFNPGATATSSLAISYSSSNPAVATINGSNVTITGVGTTVITASQAGDGNYNAAAAVPQTLTVGKGAQTISFAPLPLKAFADAPFTLDARASSSLPLSYTSSNPAVATINGTTVTVVGVGTTTITANQAGNGNYTAATAVPQTLTVGKGGASITLGGLNSTFDGTAHAATATTTPGGLPVTLTYNGSPTPPAAAGSYAVAAEINSPNYQGSATATLTIAKAAQTIAFGTLASKTVGNSPFILGAGATSGLAISYTSSNPAVATVSGATVTIVGAGTTTITASQGGDGNYNAASAVVQVLTVNAAPAAGGKAAVTINSITSYFDTLTATLAAIPAGSTVTVKLQALTFAEALNFNVSGATVTISGGFDSGFASAAGMTTIQGNLAISSGALIADRLAIM